MRSLLHLVMFLVAASALAQGSAGPCDVFPADNPWNVDVSSFPVHPLSAVFVASIDLGSSSKRVHPDFGTNPEYGIPFVYVGASQPHVPITYDAYGDESDPGPFPIPLDAPVEGGASATGDRHVIAIDTSSCMLYELFAARRDASGWTAESGATFDLTTTSYRPDGWTSADAAGLPIFPGLVRYEEVAAGSINHAIRFTSRFTQRGWIHPARHQAGRPDTTYPPMGLRMRLRSDYDVSAMTGQARVIAEALRTYGMILADNGTSWFISGTRDPRWDLEDLNQLKRIPGTAFEAVYTGPIKRRAEVSSAEPEAGVEQSIRARFDGVTVRVTLSVARPLRANVSIVDMRGEIAATVVDDEIPAGVHELSVPARLAPGPYVCRLATRDGVRVERFVVLR